MKCAWLDTTECHMSAPNPKSANCKTAHPGSIPGAASSICPGQRPVLPLPTSWRSGSDAETDAEPRPSHVYHVVGRIPKCAATPSTSLPCRSMAWPTRRHSAISSGVRLPARGRRSAVGSTVVTAGAGSASEGTSFSLHSGHRSGA